MSDSFADLWSSTPSSKTNNKTLGSLSSTSSSNALFNNSSSTLGGDAQQRRHNSNDLFSQLSASGSHSNTPRSGSRAGTPAGYAQPPPVKKTESAGSLGGDAFDGLLGSSGLSGSGKNLTMAQRAAQAEKERQDKFIRDQATKKKQDAAWDGLDMLGSGGGGSSASLATHQAKASTVDDDWGFGIASTSAAPTAKSTVTAVPSSADDDWGLDDFSSAPPTKMAAPSSASTAAPAQTNTRSQGSLWELDGFGDTNNSNSGRTDSPSRDFDWGNREDGDGLVGRHSEATAEDDILGDLGKPVQSRPKTPPRPASTRSNRVPSKPVSRTSSPPPHILGQLVEMGFSISQAKAALAATETGEDVQAALEFLISNGAAGGDEGGRHGSRRSTPDVEDRYREPPELPRRPSSGRPNADRGRSDPERTSTTSPRDRERGSGNGTPTNVSEQADRLLAQASTIGMTWFNRANAAWKDVQKVAGERAYEERVGASERQKPTTAPGDGRPKWWKEDSTGDDEEPQARPSRTTTNDRQQARERERFVDDEDEQERSRESHANGRSGRPPQRSQPEPEPEVDLFSPAPEPVKPAEPAPTAYVSRFRHGRPKPDVSTLNGSAPSSRQPALPPRPKSEPHPTSRVAASATALRTSSAHRAKGTSFFKLGDFPAAEGEYTKAIECLPRGQAVTISLFNNRALARLKNGNSSGAIEDAGRVVKLVGSGTGVVRGVVEGGEGSGLEGVELDVNLGDAIVKAWKRRAEALEGKERWEEAGKDWEKLAGADWAGQSTRSEGVRGAGRCRRMVNQEKNPEPPRSRPPPPRPKPKVATPTPANSEALKTLRQANMAAENEDAEKHALKDSVDGKLLAWKGGKESNLRALLASLDMMLWPELGVPKWGMHELVTESQVKVKYMKAIAKVHPDKLSAGTFTVEQKMLAQGVFGTLNEAWNAFKP
ncbi:auxilin-like clathrin-binding protein required for normal clathrin function [Marasmius sp. AFHP31]|nr:auxilin-like clathrin-binding protein required for normal clathrin function [Marasmius sp. AFHP31]